MQSSGIVKTGPRGRWKLGPILTEGSRRSSFLNRLLSELMHSRQFLLYRSVGIARVWLFPAVVASRCRLSSQDKAAVGGNHLSPGRLVSSDRSCSPGSEQKQTMRAFFIHKDRNANASTAWHSFRSTLDILGHFMSLRWIKKKDSMLHMKKLSLTKGWIVLQKPFLLHMEFWEIISIFTSVEL